MPLQDEQLKEIIAHSWDRASVGYDMYEGCGIRSQNERLAWKDLIVEIFPRGTRSVLDIGCGTGELCTVFAEIGYEVTGMDISEKMLETAIAKAKSCGLKIDYLKGDAENPPFSDQSFDVVFNRHLLWTLPHPQEAVTGWHRLITPGGRVIVIDGVWDNGSVGTRIRRSVGDLGQWVFEGKKPHNGRYPDEVRMELPNIGGTPCSRTMDYMAKAGFTNVRCADIRHIRKIQVNRLSFWGRLKRSGYFYLVMGEN